MNTAAMIAGVWVLLGLSTALVAQSQADPPQRKPLQPWVKKGRILAPGFAGTRSGELLSAPSVVRRKDGSLRMYFWARQQDKDYVYAAEASPHDPFQWTLVKDEPMLSPSLTGNISDRGRSFPFVLPRDDGPWLMYYGTWGSWAREGELSNRTGLAVSQDDGVTWTVQAEPLLPLGSAGSFDAGLTGSVCVLRTARDKYEMWYTAGERYEVFGGKKRGIVHIGYASSKDGVEWTKRAKPALSPRLAAVMPFEAVVSKPSVVKIGDAYHMWLSVFSMTRGDEGGYRLNYARSRDGLNWERIADDPVLPLTPGGFDSINQSYPNVIEVGDELWMFYTGDNFGATGIGLATMKKSELK